MSHRSSMDNAFPAQIWSRVTITSPIWQPGRDRQQMSRGGTWNRAGRKSGGYRAHQIFIPTDDAAHAKAVFDVCAHFRSLGANDEQVAEIRARAEATSTAELLECLKSVDGRNG